MLKRTRKTLLQGLLMLSLCLGSKVSTRQRSTDSAVAYFAGGCFWCTESDFEKVYGVTEVISGFMGGNKANPAPCPWSLGLKWHLSCFVAQQ